MADEIQEAMRPRLKCMEKLPSGGLCLADAQRFVVNNVIITRCAMHQPVDALHRDGPPEDPRDEMTSAAVAAEHNAEHNAEPNVGSRAWMAAVMASLFDECQRVREQAQKEYAHDEGNAFGNFDRVALAEGLRPDQVLRIYLRKHLDGIVAHFNGVEAQREPIRGRFIDAINYLVLLYGMAERLRLQGWLDPSGRMGQ